MVRYPLTMFNDILTQHPFDDRWRTEASQSGSKQPDELQTVQDDNVFSKSRLLDILPQWHMFGRPEDLNV